MTLRIQCPSCARQFKVNEDLKGRAVECEACEHRFKVDDEVVVQKRDRFYPGEQGDKGLAHFGRAPRAAAEGDQVKFDTVDYNQSFSTWEGEPMSPQEWFSSMTGGAILLASVLLCLWGAQPSGVLTDMEVGPRLMLTGFMVLVGAGLVGYGCRHRRKKGILLVLPLSMTAIAFAFLMPVPRTPISIPDEATLGTGEENRPNNPPAPDRPKTAAEVLELIGYAPVERAIMSHRNEAGEASEYVAVIWVPMMAERYKFQLLRYLHRKTKSVERPSFYGRGEGGIFVIDGPRLSIEQVADLAEAFGQVEESYHEIRVVEVTLNRERMGVATEDLLKELSNTSHQAFYARNQNELGHIDLDRVKGAIRRLGTAQPSMFRVEITRKMLSLLEDESDKELCGDICKALKVWAQDDDDAEAVVVRVAKAMQENGEEVPRSVLEFLVQRGSPEAIAMVEPLWISNPASWGGILAEIGPGAEDVVLKHLGSEERGLQHSAIKLLERVGTPLSVGPLRELLEVADDETKLLIQKAIESIEPTPPPS